MSGHLFLAPHLDDAVFSCGGLISRLARQGRPVVVLTAFAGANQAAKFPPAARRLHRACGYGDDDAVAVRREEDRLGTAHLGATAVHLDLPEALYRRGPGGRPRHPTLGSVFSGDCIETELMEELSESLGRQIAAHAPGTVYAPLGVGGHVDHVLLRLAVGRAGPGAVLWEDVPYAASAEPEPPPGFAAVTFPIAAPDWERKIGAARLYASQVRCLWGSARRMERALHEHSVAVGGGRPAERYWTDDAAGLRRAWS